MKNILRSKILLIHYEHAYPFFDRGGIVHHEFFRPTTEARGINGQHYLDILKRLCSRIACIRPEMFAANRWVFHQDNEPPHTSHVVIDWLAKNGTIQMLHPLYSPDTTPCDFWAFPKVKKALKNVHWGSIEEIERFMKQALKVLTQEEFEDCFQQWEECWSKCVSMKENHFEEGRVPDMYL